MQVEAKSTTKRTLHTPHAAGGKTNFFRGISASPLFSSHGKKCTGLHYFQKSDTLHIWDEELKVTTCCIRFWSISHLGELSTVEDDDENSSVASTIYLGTPGTSAEYNMLSVTYTYSSS